MISTEKRYNISRAYGWLDYTIIKHSKILIVVYTIPVVNLSIFWYTLHVKKLSFRRFDNSKFCRFEPFCILNILLSLFFFPFLVGKPFKEKNHVFSKVDICSSEHEYAYVYLYQYVDLQIFSTDIQAGARCPFMSFLGCKYRNMPLIYIS